MDNDLSKCKVGDWIATAIGWLKVQCIDENSEYPVIAKCQIERKDPIINNCRTYTNNGHYYKNDKAPSAFVEPPEWLLKYIGPKPCEFKKDELVMVRGYDDLDEMLRYFAYYEDDKYYAYDNGNTSITSRGRNSAWKYCRKAIKGEDY